MRPVTVAIVLMAVGACAVGPAHRTAGRGPSVWNGSGEETPIESPTKVMDAATADRERSGPLCVDESSDPPHTCPAKAGPE